MKAKQSSSNTEYRRTVIETRSSCFGILWEGASGRCE
jgi:hypothetical protein